MSLLHNLPMLFNAISLSLCKHTVILCSLVLLPIMTFVVMYSERGNPW